MIGVPKAWISSGRMSPFCMGVISSVARGLAFPSRIVRDFCPQPITEV